MVQSQGSELQASDRNRRSSLSISALAAAGGVGVETIRYYQRRNLLGTPVRGSGIRHYGDADVRRLRFIRHAQAAGFTLEEIRELLELDSGEDRSRARALAEGRVAALNHKIVQLQNARDSLQKLANKCGAGSTGPCPILVAFDQ